MVGVTADGGLVLHPPAAYAAWRAAGTLGAGTIAQEFDRSAALHEHVLAVAGTDGSYTFGELARRSDLIAAGLLRCGLRPGDAVLLQIDNRSESVVVWYALLKAGLVPVCTLVSHGRRELVQIGTVTEAAAIVVVAGGKVDLQATSAELAAHLPRLRHRFVIGEPADPGVVSTGSLATGDPGAARAAVADVQAGLDPDGVAVFQLSGGTTGTPKVIPRTHAEYWANGAHYARRVGIGPGDRVVHILPFVHNAGIVCAVHGPHAVGAATVLTGVEPARMFAAVTDHGGTHLLTGSGLLKAQSTHPGFTAAVAGLRTVVLSGTPAAPDVVALLVGLDVHVAQLFGMGEGPFIATEAGHPSDIRSTTVGSPLMPGDDVLVLEPDSETPVAPGEIGELCFRGPSTLAGYLDAAEHNARAFTGTGHLRTGDLVSEIPTADGPVYRIEGRIKDLINRGGEKINAEEIEQLLATHPRVRAAALVAMPDDRLDERACAYVIPDGDAPDVAELAAFLGGLGVARFKWPERVEVLDAFPTTAVGKLAKNVLRADVARKIRS